MEGINLAIAAVGLVLVLGGLIGGGLKLAGQELPVLDHIGQQVVVVVAGTLVLLFAWTTRSDFRIIQASIQADTALIALCPATVRYTGIIEVAGGPGTVEYRFVHDGQPGNAYSLEFESAGTRSISISYNIVSLPGLPSLGPDTASLEILAPDPFQTAEAQVTNLC